MTNAGNQGGSGFLGLRHARAILVGLLFAWLGLGASQALAQLKHTVVAGAELSVLKDSKVEIAIEETKPASAELYVKSTGAGDAKRWELVYRAPPAVPDQMPVVLTYKVGNQTATAEVTVTAVPVKQLKVVLPGSQTVLDRSAKIDIVEPPKDKDGWATVRPTGNTNEFELLYVAPIDGDDRPVEILYRNEDKPAKAVIVVSSNPWGSAYEAVFKALFAAFVLAAVVEWGLAVIFNWRWYLLLADAKGLKTLITLLVAFMLVATYEIDVVREVINALRNSSFETSFATQLLSAFVVAGGSAGVNALMMGLGFRSVRTAETLVGKPPPTKAWLSVSAFKASTGDLTASVQVHIKKNEGALALLTILRGLRVQNTVRWSLLRDYSRFPNYGGFHLEPGVSITVVLYPIDKDGKRIVASGGGEVVRTWGPYTPTEGAIIDIVDVF